MPRHLFLTQRLARTPAAFGLLVSEPLCWEANRSDVLLTVAVRNVRYRLRKKEQLVNARQYQTMSFEGISSTTCVLNVEFGVLPRRVTLDFRSSGRWLNADRVSATVTLYGTYTGSP
jgi:hypothetical protein